MDLVRDHLDETMALNNRIAALENFENINRIKLTPMQRFYTGSNLFITGGTGFMGKMLLEKLLRACNGVEAIYLLVRPKKEKDIHVRINELFDDLVSFFFFKSFNNQFLVFRLNS